VPIKRVNDINKNDFFIFHIICESGRKSSDGREYPPLRFVGAKIIKNFYTVIISEALYNFFFVRNCILILGRSFDIFLSLPYIGGTTWQEHCSSINDKDATFLKSPLVQAGWRIGTSQEVLCYTVTADADSTKGVSIRSVSY